MLDIDKDFIEEMFDKLKDEIYNETEQLAKITKMEIRDKFKERWMEVANKIYSDMLKNLENNYQKYDAKSINIESAKCIKDLMNFIDNFKSIIFPSFIDKQHHNLMIDYKLIEVIKTEFEKKCKTKL